MSRVFQRSRQRLAFFLSAALAPAGMIAAQSAPPAEPPPPQADVEEQEVFDEAVEVPVAPDAFGQTFDYDNDGDQDIFVAPDGEFGQAFDFEVGPLALAMSPQSKYWLGLEVAPADDTLRAHITLPEGQGVVVIHVVPDSPAAKAGIKRHDVLLKVGDHAVTSAEDLIRIVDETAEQQAPIKLLRGGKDVVIELTPEKRPEAGQGVFDLQVAPFPGGGPARMLRPGAILGGGPARMLRPGAILRGNPRINWLAEAQAFPDNLSISLTKKGKEPAKISVTRDGETWETIEGELDKLPEDVRGHVQSLLGRRTFSLGVDAPRVRIQRSGPAVPGAQPLPRRPGVQPMRPRRPDAPPAARRRVVREGADDLRREVEELRKAVDELRKSLQKPDAQSDNAAQSNNSA